MSDGRLPARRRWWGWTIGLAVLIVVLATAWVVVRGIGATLELQNVRTSVAQLRTAIADRELERAERIAPRIAQHAALAHDLTADAIWRGFEFIPWLGANFTTMREIAEITDSVATSAVTRPIIDVAHGMNTATLGFSGARLDLGPLADVRSILEPASSALKSADAAAQRIDAGAALAPVGDAVREAQGLIREVSTTVGALHGASALLPGMLGGGEPRNHLVMLQDNTEIRSHGGAIAALALVRTDKGAISLVRTVSVRDLPPLDDAATPDDAAVAVFGDTPVSGVRDATSMPDFASTAQLVAQQWQQHYGEEIDSVVAIDFVAAAHLIEATGPVSFAEYTADADTLVSVLTADLPAAVPDPALRDAVLADAGASLLSAVLGSVEPGAVIEAVAAAAEDDRIRVWSARPEEELQLAASALGGALPADGDTGIHVGVLLNDATGSPLGSHAHATISTATGVCHGEPTTQVRVTWTSDVSEEDAGDIRTLVAVYGPEGATVDGDASTTLGTRPVALRDLTLAPGESESFTASFTGTGAGERFTHLHHTPLLEQPDVVRADVECG